jgi:predicted nucleotidyltransferase
VRLSESMRQVIKSLIQEAFGPADLYLFGSRADDSRVGGDIDLAVDLTLNHDEFRRRKCDFLAKMLRRGYDIAIDVVPYNPDNVLFREEIHKNAIKL